ncbi:16S rRNA (adenine(1518)-N(6)/adenine(1519)-N(6))-dimethyltransferase RsmA [Salidesulfovibrio onnuriiensis]|uniref:16S rRNA (adenine(1518)-N(6)/adenine(1519)-N(6))- dimethyltransferase RsmA n=1 Tax=Salidesulfovibrio onnuriiensis TaxID=2583823 RepID=UPI0011C7F9A4|nr:16S rRNA (adenine(1518)-N(6)/adenine(1519)-N(6))-dimethyltransferase RsmA [Salidesulfovibrio onnuriiensis]
MNENRLPRAKKSLGQNFLVDKNICAKIVAQLQINPDDHVLEIGPGRGALTEFLVSAAPASLTVLEKDNELAERLEGLYPEIGILQMDALAFDWQSLDPGTKIIGNLPYNIASKLIWDIVSKAVNMTKATFMVQHEVALRLTAQPSNKEYGGLTVWVKNHTETEYRFKVPPHVFRPQPKIDSAIVDFFPLPLDQRPENPEQLSTFIKTCFQKRRKQLANILKKQWNEQIEAWFSEQGLSPQTRPENLSPGQFKSLSALV